MKCPYCGEEMQKGYVPTDTIPAQWIPDGEKQSIFKYSYSKVYKKIIYEDTYQGIHATAEYCKSCGIILLKEDR